MKEQYIAPTLRDLKETFAGSRVGRPVKVKGSKSLDAQRFIVKLNKAYEATKQSCIQFD